MAQAMTLPSYEELPVSPGAPKGSSWGLWGPDDVLGCLNLLTPEKAMAGMAAGKDGHVFNLNLELELPDPPLFGRAASQHVVSDLGNVGHDDLLDAWNTQRSSQWDGFRHVMHPAHGFYNGVDDERHGVHHWARRGMVTRGVLADVARWRESVGRAISPGAADPISMDDVAAALGEQGTNVEPGDVLLLRTGWLGYYRRLDEHARAAMSQPQALRCCGLERGIGTVAALWNLHVAAVAADNPGLEVMPAGDRENMTGWLEDPELAADSMLHFCLLGLLGLPIGELFDLDRLAEHCRSTGRYTFLLTSAPLNLHAGVATPPNALAIT